MTRECWSVVILLLLTVRIEINSLALTAALFRLLHLLSSPPSRQILLQTAVAMPVFSVLRRECPRLVSNGFPMGSPYWEQIRIFYNSTIFRETKLEVTQWL